MITEMEDFCKARDAGGIVEIDQEMFYYFLEVLPPIWMNTTVTMPDGRAQYTAFGFAEGMENVTVFWSKKEKGAPEETRKYFAQLTNIRNFYA